MTLSITDLNNAKTDVDHIAAVANSTNAQETDRLGNTKLTMAGASAQMSAQVALVQGSANTAINTTIPALVDLVDEAVAATYVGQANVAKVAAQTAQAGSEAARNIAVAAANTFSTTAEGLAATTSGQFFLLRTSVLREFSAYYNNAGSAVLLGTLKVADADDLEALIGSLFSVANSSYLRFTIDLDGKIVETLTPAGVLETDDFQVRGQATTVGTQVAEATATAFTITSSAYAHIFIDVTGKILATLSATTGAFETAASSGSTLLDARMGVNSYSADGAGLKTIDYAKNAARAAVSVDTLIAAYGAGGSTGYNQRIPGIVRVGQNKLIVFNAEHTIDGSGGDGYGQRLVYRTVTYDPSGPSVTVGSRNLLVAPPDATTTHNHIHAVKITYGGKNSGRIQALYQHLKVGNWARIYQTYSDDNGATWSAGTLVDTSAFDANWAVLGSSGTFVEVPYGPYKGRLLFPVYCETGTNKMGLFYSDDGGATWALGGTVLGSAFGVTDLNETAVAFAHNGDLLLTSRSDPNLGYNHITRSSDGGRTLTANGHDPNIQTTQCAMSLFQMAPDIGDGVPKIVWAGPAPTSITNSRTRARVRVSYDRGYSFPVEYAPLASDSDPFGYSSGCALDDSTMAIAYEVPVGGNANTQESLRILIINMARVIQNGSGY